MNEPYDCYKLKSQGRKEFDEGIAKVELPSWVYYWVLSGSKFVVWDISSDLRPSGLVNKLEGPKNVFLAASGEGWVEQSPLGVSPLLHIIQVLTFIICLWYNSKSVFSFGSMISTCKMDNLICYELSIWKKFWWLI